MAVMSGVVISRPPSVVISIINCERTIWRLTDDSLRSVNECRKVQAATPYSIKDHAELRAQRKRFRRVHPPETRALVRYHSYMPSYSSRYSAVPLLSKMYPRATGLAPK
jgi:hypothetical protein